MTREGVPPETVGEQLRRTLEEKGLSQAELARRLAGPEADGNKVANTRRQVVAWVNDERAPDDASAARLERELDQPPGTFRTDRRPSLSAAAAQLAQTARAIEAALEALTQIAGHLVPLLERQEALVLEMQSFVTELRRRAAASEGAGGSR